MCIRGVVCFFCALYIYDSINICCIGIVWDCVKEEIVEGKQGMEEDGNDDNDDSDGNGHSNDSNSNDDGDSSSNGNGDVDSDNGNSNNGDSNNSNGNDSSNDEGGNIAKLFEDVNYKYHAHNPAVLLVEIFV